MGSGSSPTDWGGPLRRTVSGDAKPSCGRSNRPANPSCGALIAALAVVVTVASTASTMTKSAVRLNMATSKLSPVDEIPLPQLRESGELAPPGADHLVDPGARVHHQAQPVGAGEL